jgi:hypothetical protein
MTMKNWVKNIIFYDIQIITEIYKNCLVVKFSLKISLIK